MKQPDSRFPIPDSRKLSRDPNWQIRRQALWALAEEPIPICWEVLRASDDPHEEVRQALVEVLLKWCEDSVVRHEMERRLVLLAEGGVRSRGVLEYLRHRWAGGDEAFPSDLRVDHPRDRCSFWDDDPAVLARSLQEMTDNERLLHLDTMPFLLSHDDERVRTLALATLQEFAECRHLAECLTILDEPRRQAPATVRKLLDSLGEEQREELALEILSWEHATPNQLAFAIDQISEFGVKDLDDSSFRGNPSELQSRFQRWKSDPSPMVRQSLIRLLDRWPNLLASGQMLDLLDDADPEVQLEALQRLNTRREEIPLKTVGFLLTSPDEEIRCEAIRTLFRQGQQAEWIAELLDDPSPQVREALAAEVRTFGTGLP